MVGFSAWGAETAVDLRFRFSPSQPDALAPGFQYEARVASALLFSGAAQLAFSPREVRHLVYQAGLSYAFFPVLRLETSVFHLVLPAAGAGWTGLVGKFAFDVPISTNWFDVYGAFGWYERFSQAFGAGILPLPASHAEREHDLLFRLGTRARVADRWTIQFETASFDEYEVYNLNGPFLQAAADYAAAPDETWRGYARYQMLLGFGRLNELIVGAEVRFLQ